MVSTCGTIFATGGEMVCAPATVAAATESRRARRIRIGGLATVELLEVWFKVRCASDTSTRRKRGRLAEQQLGRELFDWRSPALGGECEYECSQRSCCTAFSSLLPFCR